MWRRKARVSIFIFILGLPLAVWAGDASPKGFLDSLACINNGACGLDDITVGLVELIKLLLGMMGAVALVYFVWGGIRWITSGGNMEKISIGRNIMINTVLALVVAFSSYVLLDFFVNDLLGANQEFQVSAECSQAENGGRCRGSDIYQCYQGTCMSKCEILNRILLAAPLRPDPNPDGILDIGSLDRQNLAQGHDFSRRDSLACERVENPSAVGHFRLYCPPGDNNFVCVFRRSGAIQPALP